MKLLTAIPISALMFFTQVQSASAQQKRLDFFPRLVAGLSASYYNSFITNFEKENSKEPMVGGFAGAKLVNLSSSDGLYGVTQFHYLAGRRAGSEYIKSNEYMTSLGLRYKKSIAIFERPNSLVWLGGGLSALRLDRVSRRNGYRIVVDPGNRIRKEEYSLIDVERWRTLGFYLEAGQTIPFQAKNTPMFGFFWNIKYDSGYDQNLNLGSISVSLGFNYMGFYRS